MKNIALGQFYPSNSIIHRLDPRMKIILATAYIVASFLCKSLLSFSVLLLSSVVLILISRIPLKIVLRGLRAIIFIMAFTSILNIFWTTGDEENLLLSWRFINIYAEGVYKAVFIVVRIVSMIIGSSIFLTYTTTPIQLTDGIEQLLSPLKKIRVPVHEFAMMMTIALRFIPTISEETEKIMSAQKARGADFSSGSLIKRVKALVPVIVPLFISAFRRAGDLATAMICRCYRGGKGRTRMTVLRFGARDFVFLFIAAIFITGLVFANMCGFGYTM